MAGPLSGVRVVDLTSMVSGPLATMTLADQGADVIKVETPHGGDYSRHVATRRNGFSASFLNNNRNKRSLVLDLKRRVGLEVLKRLVEGADVFVQNFRPGVAERMGAGEDALRAHTSAHLLETLEAHDVPCSPVLRRRDMIRHPQIVANGIIEEREHAVAGRLRQTRQPARFSATGVERRDGAPRYGEHTREVLQEVGLSRSEIDRLISTGTARDEGSVRASPG